MEGKRNRGEVTAELSEKVWARLCRENALVASEVWVDDASRVDFVAYRPHRPRDRSSNHATAAELESGTFTFVEVKSCMDDFTSGHGRTFEGDENWLVCPLELADSLASKGMLPKGAAVYSPDARGALRKRYDTSEFRQVRVAPAIELIWAMRRCPSRRTMRTAAMWCRRFSYPARAGIARGAISTSTRPSGNSQPRREGPRPFARGDRSSCRTRPGALRYVRLGTASAPPPF